MELHQIQVTYQPEDDRILLRVSLHDGDGGLEEIRAWLTRRLTRNLWAGLIKAMDAQVKITQPQAAHASAEIISMEHYASVNETRQSGGFDLPFQSGAHSYPLGETPLLATRAQFKVSVGKPVRLDFGQPDGSNFELAFTPTALHAFCRLLQEASRNAEWELNLKMPSFVQSEVVPKQKLN